MNTGTFSLHTLLSVNSSIKGITSISCYDVTSTGLCDIILGHSDGIVQLYSLDENNQPSIQFTHAFNEGITSVCGGDVSSPGSPEIVISTSNGLVHGLTRDSSHKKKGTISSEVKAKIESLKEEISQLEERVEMSHKHYQSMTSGDDVGIMSALTQFPINDQFVLNIDEAWYTLVIETKVPLDIVILQCDVPVDLQETDNSTAVLSHTPPDIKNNNYLLATFHCNGINRLEVKVRSIEGQYGTLSVYVSPQVEPHSARLKTYSIRPLSLHQRTHSFDASLPLNQLTISGQFSLSDVHSWVRFCLPDVPDRPPDGESVVLQFKSSFTSTQLQCVYRQNEANFKSDNLSTISVIKEVISKEATKQNISIKMTHNINHDSIPHMLHLLYPKLEEQLTLAKNIQLIEALQEIKIHEGGDVSFLSPQCQLILDHATSLQEEIKRQPSMIDRLYALITDLFMDRATFKGANVKHKVPELLSLLDDCTVDILVQFFNDNN
jgi:Bardet-Biedl syndrome 7 protein